MRRLFPIGLALLLTGCGTFPQTPEEFRAYYLAETRPFLFDTIARQETYETRRSFREVERRLTDRIEHCLNVTVRKTAWVGTHLETTVMVYHTKIRRVGKDRAEITLQQDGAVGVGAKAPEGGAYIMLVDLESKKGGGTSMTMYGRSVGPDFFEAFERWANGGDPSCPDL